MKWIQELLNMPLRIIGALAIAASIILFVPEQLAELTSISSFRKEYGFAIGVTLITTLSILLVPIVINIFAYFKEIIKNNLFYRISFKRLRELSDYQKSVIFLLYSVSNNTHELPVHDGAIKLLQQYLIISQTTSTYLTFDYNNLRMPFFLQPWVKKYIDNHIDYYNHIKECCLKEEGQEGLDYVNSLK
ncbi:MAG: superinfection exclusion B family protein [Erysipelothrix sp.]|nr:superinfection exclusion B family protein [Erysipelothrix sp.]